MGRERRKGKGRVQGNEVMKTDMKKSIEKLYEQFNSHTNAK